jgi:hypothetical protein
MQLISLSIFRHGNISSPVLYYSVSGARTSVVGWGRKVLSLIPDEVIGFFNSPNPSSHAMVLGITQLLTGINTMDFPGDGGKGHPARKADVITICEPAV